MSRFKTLALAFLMLSMSFNSVADSCHYVKEQKDPFTNETSWIAKEMACGIKTYMNLERIGDKFFLGFKILTAAVVDEAFTTDKKVLLKLENGDVIEVSTDTDVKPEAHAASGAAWTTWVTRMSVSRDVYQKLSKSPVVMIKYPVAAKEELEEVRDRQGRKIMETAQCLIAH